MPIEIQPERPRNIEGNGDFELKSAVSWMNQIVLPRIQIDAFFDLSTLYQSVQRITSQSRVLRLQSTDRATVFLH